MLDFLLDATIVFSFDGTGFRRHAESFEATDLDVDLSGRTMLVTGANSGLGRAAARALAARGAEIRLLCRSEERGREAEETLRGETGNPEVHLELVDLASLASVRAFARRWGARPVDVLIHNAGVLPDEKTLTEDGLESTFATNTVGPHLLTRLLLDNLRAGDDARVIDVSSGGMYTQRLDLAKLRGDVETFDGVVAYAQTKRANVILAEMWAERDEASGIAFHSMHPGWADTPGVERSLPTFHRLLRGRLRTPREGADTILWLAAVDRDRIGEAGFWFDREDVSPYLLPFTRERRHDREALWALVEEAIGAA